MNITFLIGNGFDLNIGLKTSYYDFYSYFFNKASEKNIIRNWIKEEDILWADLELGIGKSLSNLDVGDVDNFYNDKDELDWLLLDYLEEQQNKVTDDLLDKMKEEMIRSLNSFEMGLAATQKQSIENIKKTYANDEFNYQFITFNYTNVLDRIIKFSKKQNPISTHLANNGTSRKNIIDNILHINGTIESEMILGVNDKSQINNEKLRSNDEFLDTFIKPRMNKALAQNKENIAKNIISYSHIIYIFGMSIGETDRFWWQEIAKWLTVSDNNRLIIFCYEYDNALKRRLPSKIVRKSNQVINDFMNKAYPEKNRNVELINKIKSRIFVTFESNIFKFEKIKDSGNIEDNEIMENVI